MRLESTLETAGIRINVAMLGEKTLPEPRPARDSIAWGGARELHGLTYIPVHVRGLFGFTLYIE